MKRATAILLLSLLPCALAAQYSSVNSHVSLNGSSYISVPYSFDLNEALTYAGTLSIDAWVMPTSLGTMMTIVGNDLASGYWFGLSAAGKLRFSPYPSGQFESSSAINTDTWTHVGVHYDPESSVVRFYINGVLDRTVSVVQGYVGYSYFDLRIGADRSNNAPAYYWKGHLDEVRIWRSRINFATALGDLYRVPHAVSGGLYGQDLVAAWRMNGNANDHANAHNGSHVGSVAYLTTPDASFYPRIGVRFQNSGGAANSVDHFEIPFSKGLELRNNYTIEFWVKPNSTGGHAQYQTLFCKDVSSPVAAIYPVWIGINKGNGRLRFVPNGDMQNWFESTVALPVGKWTHVAARFYGASGSYTATLFVDGLPKGEKKYTAQGPSNTSRIILAASSTSASSNTLYGFNGFLDELRIWDAIRTDGEIADNYRREFSGPNSHLEAVYRFDGDVLDGSGNNHHGLNSYGYSLWYFYRSDDLPSEPALTLTSPLDGETWTIGDPVTVKWNSVGLHYATVDLSRDGGSTWTEILYNAGSASAGSVNWTVTGPESGDVHVRVRTPTPTGIEDRATKIAIRPPTPLMQVAPPSITMVVSRNAPLPQPVQVVLANIGGGTLSWAAQTGGAPWLAVQPAQGTANADTFEVSLTTTNLPEGQYAESIEIGGNASNHGLQIPVTLTVTAQRVYSVSGVIRDPTGAPVEAIPVRATGERDVTAESGRDGKYMLDFLPSGDYSVAPASFYYTSAPAERTYTPLNNFEPGADFTVTPRRGSLILRYHEGWNLFSIPLEPDETDLLTLLPDAIPPAYAWDPDSGYVMRWKVDGLRTYWVKFSKRDSITVNGLLVRDMMVAYTASQTGWNLFCGPSGDCPVTEITQAPSGILLSTYSYDPYYGYIPPPDGMIEPGKGYFVKIAAPGNLYLRADEYQSTSPVRNLLRYPGVSRPQRE
jgi:hypothetical protein